MMKRIIGFLLLSLIFSVTAQSQQYQAFIFLDGSGNPYPTGSGSPLPTNPPYAECYTNASGQPLPCSFSGGGGSGTVTSFSAGNLSPLFTTSVATATTTPALTFSLSNAAQNSVLAGPATGGAGAPTYQTAPTFSGANLTNLPAAAAGTLTGTTLASNVVSSSLTSAAGGSFGTAAYVATGTSGGTIPLLNGNLTWSGTQSVSTAGAASTAAVTWTGAPFTGGNGTTTFPYLYYNSGTAPTTWSTSGTIFGINAPSGFAGDYFDFHTNGGTSVASLNTSGQLTTTGAVTSSNSYLNTSNTGSYATGTSSDTAWCRNAAGVWEASTSRTCNSSGSLLVTGMTASTYATGTNCSSSASPAVCAAAASGSVAVPASGTTLVVDTTAVTANSQILLTFDSSLGTKLSVTCNTTINQPSVSARTAATSFTITMSGSITTNPDCISYMIIN